MILTRRHEAHLLCHLWAQGFYKVLLLMKESRIARDFACIICHGFCKVYHPVNVTVAIDAVYPQTAHLLLYLGDREPVVWRPLWGKPKMPIYAEKDAVYDGVPSLFAFKFREIEAYG